MSPAAVSVCVEDGGSAGWSQVVIESPGHRRSPGSSKVISSLGWFCLRIGGLGWSVPVVVLVSAEQLEGLGGLGEDANGFGAAYLDWI